MCDYWRANKKSHLPNFAFGTATLLKVQNKTWKPSKAFLYSHWKNTRQFPATWRPSKKMPKSAIIAIELGSTSRQSSNAKNDWTASDGIDRLLVSNRRRFLAHSKQGFIFSQWTTCLIVESVWSGQLLWESDFSYKHTWMSALLNCAQKLQKRSGLQRL